MIVALVQYFLSVILHLIIDEYFLTIFVNLVLVHFKKTGIFKVCPN